MRYFHPYLLKYKYLGFILFILSLSGCVSSSNESALPKIVCTTGMLGDAAKQLLQENADVTVLMGPGVDPHLYKASQGDIATLTNAEVIVYNGLHLEGKMGEIFEKLSRTKTVLAAAEVLSEEDLISAADFSSIHDPHVWFDVAKWTKVVKGLSAELQKLYPAIKDSIAFRESAYVKELEKLDTFCKTQISVIPKEQRVLVTAHDAFKYFGQAYEIQVMGLQGISTTAEYGLQDVSNLVTYISENKIKAIFVESSVSPKSIEAVIEGCKARGHEVKLGGELYSDALGKSGTPEGTYLGMVKHNVEVISKALR